MNESKQASRRAGSVLNYEPTHGNLLSGKGYNRSCGMCGKHKPLAQGGKPHRVLGWCCASCNPKE